MRPLLISMALLMAACTGSGDPPATAPTQLPPSITVSTVPDSVIAITTTTSPGVPLCLAGEEPFTTIGIVGTVGRGLGDATHVSEVRLASFGGGTVTCDRLTMTFATDDGAPATALGGTGIEVLRSANVVRVSLPPAITATAISDILFDSPLVRSIFVVQDDLGALFVDIHLSADVTVRADLFASPARLVIDVQPEENGPGLPAARISDSAVIISSTEGGFGYPIRISGYTRGRIQTLTVEITDGVDRAEQTIESSEYPWRAFDADFTTGPTGDVVLRVGDLETVIPIG